MIFYSYTYYIQTYLRLPKINQLYYIFNQIIIILMLVLGSAVLFPLFLSCLSLPLNSLMHEMWASLKTPVVSALGQQWKKRTAPGLNLRPSKSSSWMRGQVESCLKDALVLTSCLQIDSSFAQHFFLSSLLSAVNTPPATYVLLGTSRLGERGLRGLKERPVGEIWDI